MIYIAFLSLARYTGFRRFTASGICLMILFGVQLAVAAQAPSKPSSKAEPRSRAASAADSRTTLMAFLSLESLATAMKSVNHQTAAPTESRSKETTSKSSPEIGTQQQYATLYRALLKLERTRAEYIETLNLYVRGVQSHLAPEYSSRRLEAFRGNLRSLRTDLQALKDAFDPLQLSLDYAKPEVSGLIERYISTRQAKGAAAELIDTFSVSELQELSRKAVENGRLIDGAVAQLREFIKQKYPGIAGG